MSAAPPEPPVVRENQTGFTATCPHCREPVAPNAYVCPHCLRRLRMSELLKGGLIVAAVGLACIGVTAIVLTHDSRKPAPAGYPAAAAMASASGGKKTSPIDTLARNFEERGFPIIEGTQASTLAGEKGVIVNLVSSRWDSMSGDERRQFLHLEAWKACEADLAVDFIEFRSAGKRLGRLEHSTFQEP